MLKYHVRRSQAEPFQAVQTPPKGDVWVHGDEVTEEDLETVAKTYGMDINILRDVLDQNELPRVEISDGATYVFVRGVEGGKRGHITMTPILLAVKGSVFTLLSMAKTSDRMIVAPNHLAQADDAMSLLLATFTAAVAEYEDLMRHTARHIHDTARRLRTHEVTNDDFIKFVTVEDNLNEYRMNLTSMQVVAERLHNILKHEDDLEADEDTLLYIRQLLVEVENYSQSVVSIRNAYGTIANNVLNQRMKTLTVLTLLVALPNVFFGMYGMNINLPFQDQPWAYLAVVVSSGAIILLVYLFAKMRKVL